VWLILTLFAVGYVFGVLRRRDQWTLDLARVNTGMGLVVLAILLLANSPVLDFRKLSMASQLARVEAGEIELREFDFLYARSHLARPGYLALTELKAQARTWMKAASTNTCSRSSMDVAMAARVTFTAWRRCTSGKAAVGRVWPP
jgi:hypothetical protein